MSKKELIIKIKLLLHKTIKAHLNGKSYKLIQVLSMKNHKKRRNLVYKRAVNSKEEEDNLLIKTLIPSHRIYHMAII